MLLATAEGFFVVPPVDVWLVWHVYMLNPMSVPALFSKRAARALTLQASRWYMEDCERSWFLRPLRNLRDDPMDLAVSARGVMRPSFASWVRYRPKWVMIFSITGPLLTKMASGRPVRTSLSTRSFHLLLYWIWTSIVPGANDRLMSVSRLKRSTHFSRSCSGWDPLSIREHGGHGIRPGRFRNRLSVLRYARHEGESGRRQIHKRYRPRPR